MIFIKSSFIFNLLVYDIHKNKFIIDLLFLSIKKIKLFFINIF